jgi:hypothetical protein
MKSIGKALLIAMILLMTACSNSQPSKEIKINGKVKANGNAVSVYGTSSLPKNAILSVVLKEINGTENIKETTIVDKDGNFSLNLSRTNREKEYELNVVFLPAEQENVIKKKFGEKGEFVSSDSYGFFHYSIKDKKYKGIKMYDRINKIGDGQVGQDTMLVDRLPDYSY